MNTSCEREGALLEDEHVLRISAPVIAVSVLLGTLALFVHAGPLLADDNTISVKIQALNDLHGGIDSSRAWAIGPQRAPSIWPRR